MFGIGMGSGAALGSLGKTIGIANQVLGDQTKVQERAAAFKGQMAEASQQLTEKNLATEFAQKQQESANKQAQKSIQSIIT